MNKPPYNPAPAAGWPMPLAQGGEKSQARVLPGRRGREYILQRPRGMISPGPGGRPGPFTVVRRL